MGRGNLFSSKTGTCVLVHLRISIFNMAVQAMCWGGEQSLRKESLPGPQWERGEGGTRRPGNTQKAYMRAPLKLKQDPCDESTLKDSMSFLQNSSGQGRQIIMVYRMTRLKDDGRSTTCDSGSNRAP